MPESGPHGSVREAVSNERPYRDFEVWIRHAQSFKRVARIKLGLDETLTLGNLEARRDWGHTRDYVRAKWLMLLCRRYRSHYSVRQMCGAAFAHVGLRMIDHVTVDPDLTGPAEVDVLRGEASKVGQVQGWRAEISSEEMITEIVDADLTRLTSR